MCVCTWVLYTCVYMMCTCVCPPSWINMQRIEEDIGVSFSIAFWLIPLRQGLSLTPKLPLLARHAGQWIPKICLSLLPKMHACPAGVDPPLCLLNPGNRFLDIRGICRGWEEGSTGRCVTSEEHVEDEGGLCRFLANCSLLLNCLLLYKRWVLHYTSQGCQENKQPKQTKQTKTRGRGQCLEWGKIKVRRWLEGWFSSFEHWLLFQTT